MAPPHLSPILDEPTLKRLAEQLAPEIATLAKPGNSEWLRYLIGLVMAALVAYFTTTSTTREALATQKATEESHFGEVLRRLDAMATDIRDLRGQR